PELGLGASAPILAAQLQIEALALGRILRGPLELFELSDALLDGVGALAQDVTKLRRLRPQLVIGNALQPRILRVDLIDDGLYAPPFALMARSKDLRYYLLEHVVP